MKKNLVLLLSLVLLVSLACPIFASAESVDYPEGDEEGPVFEFWYTGTTGGGGFWATKSESMLSIVLYCAMSGYPSVPNDVEPLVKSVLSNTNEFFTYLCETYFDRIYYDLEYVRVDPSFFVQLNNGLKKAGSSLVVSPSYAFRKLSYGPGELNNIKGYANIFVTESEFEEESTEGFFEAIFFDLKINIRSILFGLAEGFETVRDKFTEFGSYIVDGFQNLNNRFLESFTTFGNQLYALRDRISDGESLGTIIKNGFQDVFKNSWIGQQFTPDNFEDESFNQYDDFLDELEDDRLALLDKIDSFEFGFRQAIQEISSALIFVSMVFGVFAQIPFLQTVFNVSLALGMTATVLGLVPMIADRFANKKEEYK